MYDFGAEKELITTEESWGHDITLIIDTDTTPKGSPSEITGEITGFFATSIIGPGFFYSTKRVRSFIPRASRSMQSWATV